MVRGFLEARLIRPSCSHFSSLVLFVKKTDGSWKFCVDFRYLNAIIVKDKHPISIIDELHDSRQHSIISKENLKLSPKFYGPYMVLERLRPVAYRLLLPTNSLIHDVFHVSLLKKHDGSIPKASPVLPPVSTVESNLPQFKPILDG
nr:uncharacterized protein LOC125418708 [Ziziphus jujuba var. spinosa]